MTLPLPLTTRAGLEEIDRSLETLSDEELDAVIERARQRAGPQGDEAVAAIIAPQTGVRGSSLVTVGPTPTDAEWPPRRDAAPDRRRSARLRARPGHWALGRNGRGDS